MIILYSLFYHLLDETFDMNKKESTAKCTSTKSWKSDSKKASGEKMIKSKTTNTLPSQTKPHSKNTIASKLLFFRNSKSKPITKDIVDITSLAISGQSLSNKAPLTTETIQKTQVSVTLSESAPRPVTTIRVETPSGRNTPSKDSTTGQPDITVSTGGGRGDDNENQLGIPDRNRKFSDNDSAVDITYQGDSSDFDSSRCPSSTHGVAPEKELSGNRDDSVKTTAKIQRSESSSSWRKIRTVLVWTPFIQHCSKRQYAWIQIAGHQGNFKPGKMGTILKKHCARESICLQSMNDDIISDFVPKFRSEVNYEGEKYICMQDLLAEFDQPSLMDVKMGRRTYLEEELVKAHKSPKPRQDMYEKMIAVDKDAPTDEENRIRAVLKPRYMVWRETLSSTITLGFRVEGVKKISELGHDKSIGTQSRSFKKTKYRHEVKDVLLDYIDGNIRILKKFLERLQNLKEVLEKSKFFWDHEFIGSSLLFVYDKNQRANVWLIDFGKTVPLPPGVKIDHVSDWQEGNHEDGYLFGLQELNQLLQDIETELRLTESSSVVVENLSH